MLKTLFTVLSENVQSLQMLSMHTFRNVCGCRFCYRGCPSDSELLGDFFISNRDCRIFCRVMKIFDAFRQLFLLPRGYFLLRGCFQVHSGLSILSLTDNF